MSPEKVASDRADQAGHKDRTKTPVRHKRLWRGLLFILLLLVLLGGVVFWAIGTHSGLVVLYASVQRFAPGVLEINKLQGALLGPLELNGIQIRVANTEIDIERLQWDWRPSRLFKGQLSLGELALQDCRIKLAESMAADAEKAESAAPIAIPESNPLPLSVDVESIEIAGLKIVLPQQTIDLAVIRFGAKLDRTGLHITRASAEADAWQIGLTGRFALAPKNPLSADIHWSLRVAEDRQVKGHGQVQGELNNFAIEHHVTGIAEADLTASISDVLADLSWTAELSLVKLRSRDLDPTLPDLSAKGLITASGRISSLKLHSKLNLESPEWGNLELQDLLLGFDGELLSIERLKLRAPTTGSLLQGQAQWQVSDQPPAIRAKFDWQDLAWPLKGQPQFISRSGNIELAGNLDDYQLQLQGQVSGAEIPSTQIKAKAHGNAEQIELSDLQLGLLEGRIAASGAVRWLPEVKWNMRAKAQDLNPKSQWEALSGRIAAEFTTQGRIKDNKPDVDFQLTELQGQLNEYPLSGSALVRLSGESLTVSNLSLASGNNELQASGRLNDSWDMRWSIQARNLGELLPSSKGSLLAEGKVFGARFSPDIDAKLDAQDIVWLDYQVKQLRGDIQLPLSGEKAIHVDINGEALVLAGQTLSQLAVTGDGTRQAHQLALKLNSQYGVLHLNADAMLDEANQWSGDLSDLSLDTLQFGQWKLQQSTKFVVSNKLQDMERACVKERDTAAQLCAEFKYLADGELVAVLELSRLALQTFREQLPEDLAVKGTVSGRVKAVGKLPEQLLADAEFTVPDGLVEFDFDGESKRLDFSQTQLSAKLDQAGVRGEIAVPIEGQGKLEGNFSLPDWNGLQALSTTQAVKGSIKGGFNDLSVVASLVPELAEVRGRIAIDLALGGNLGAPLVSGQAQLLDAGVEVPTLGLAITQVGLEVSSKGAEQLVFKGQAVSGGGRLAISGETRLAPDAGFPTKLQLTGEKFVVADIPEAWVLVSPDISLELVENRQILRGDIYIPRARLRPKSLPEGYVSASTDVVVAGRQSSEAAKPPNTEVDIRLRLGNQISFEGFGLRSRFEGNLAISQQPGKPSQGKGQVTMHEGTYRAYGQDLNIERGRFIFADSPLENPGVDLRAARQVGDVTAGVRVTGTLKKPTLKVYSDPAMTQTEAMSYLVLGRPMKGGDQDAGRQLVGQAAAAGGDLLAKEIGRQLGLDDISVEQGESGKDLSLTVGTYLSPELYLQYLSDLKQRSSQVRLIYDLTERIQLQTETGQSHGLDIFYKIER